MAQIELVTKLTGSAKTAWTELLANAGLTPDLQIKRTALVWEEDQLIATASRMENIIKCVAVAEGHQGEGLTASLLTALRQDAFAQGYDHLFLYTKPENKAMFQSLFFYPVAETDKVLLMESKKDGIRQFLQAQEKPSSGKAGAAVINGNPFTKGHRYLIETAARQCEHLYVFVLSEDKSEFSFRDRFAMARLGTQDLENVTVLPTGPYLISAATFPTYFLKKDTPGDREQCKLDAEVFARWYAPHFGIDRRFVGTEPTCATTACYNRVLQELLPRHGIAVTEIPRLTHAGSPVSASVVRQYLKEGKDVSALLPKTTLDHLSEQEESL